MMCHSDIWNRTGNTPPADVSIASAVDVDGVSTVYGTAGERLSFTAVVGTNPDQDELSYEWSFGDGSPMNYRAKPLRQLMFTWQIRPAPFFTRLCG